GPLESSRRLLRSSQDSPSVPQFASWSSSRSTKPEKSTTICDSERLNPSPKDHHHGNSIWNRGPEVSPASCTASAAVHRGCIIRWVCVCISVFRESSVRRESDAGSG